MTGPDINIFYKDQSWWNLGSDHYLLIFKWDSWVRFHRSLLILKSHSWVKSKGWVCKNQRRVNSFTPTGNGHPEAKRNWRDTSEVARQSEEGPEPLCSHSNQSHPLPLWSPELKPSVVREREKAEAGLFNSRANPRRLQRVLRGPCLEKSI